MTTKAVATVAKELSNEELTALLQGAGWAEKSSGDAIQRMKFTNSILSTPDGTMYVYNPSKPKTPAMTVRIVKPPEEYWAMYINERMARDFGDMSLANTFSKKFVQPDESRRVWPSDARYDDIRNAELIDDYGKVLKPAWKADILLQIIPEDGQLTGSEPVYTLTLSTTSLIEFKGTSKAPTGGVVSDQNFITKLSVFAQQQEGMTDAKVAVLNALTSLTLGGVAAEVRVLQASNKDNGQTWGVIVFDPIHIEPMDTGDALLASGAEDGE